MPDDSLTSRGSTLKRVLVGKPIATDEADHQRLSKRIGLAVFSSDAISSTAYASGEVMLVLVGVGGMAAASNLIPIAILVIVLLALVANSYRETIHAYPDGGGSYIVSRENLGEMPSLVAGASLLIDYVLTVAVSVAAGTLAITSAFPELRPYKVWFAVFFVALLTVGNLRGVKESGRVFAVPTYVYIVMMGIFIGYGLYRHFGPGTLPVLNKANARSAEVEEHFGPFASGVSAFIFARAFASGAVALSGVEAISNGIPAFRKPTSKNAAITLGWMAAILGAGFLGISFMAARMLPMPSESESVISIMGRSLFGEGSVLYYILQFSTFAILILAANTAFADFPRLAAIISRDGYLPRQFSNRGDRLVFSNGIIILAGLAGALLVGFDADVTHLIPLYAVGVFTSFTLSQTGMVVHHLKERQPKWQLSLVASALGALATLIVAAVVIISKFMIGAWVIVVAIPLVVMGFKAVSRHYKSVAQQLAVEPGPEAAALRHGMVVLVGGINRSALMALRYARSVHADNLIAVTVAIDEDHAEKIRADWERYNLSVPLEVLESPYRDLTGVVLDHLDVLDKRWGHDYLSVIIPQMVPEHWWQNIFHNQSATALRLRLLNRHDTVLVSVPYHVYDDVDRPNGRRRSGATAHEASVTDRISAGEG
jgi:amino acid transporter